MHRNSSHLPLDLNPTTRAMDACTHSRMKHGGFTLVELLVVISIVAVLAGMLLPAVSTVKNAARASQCMSNMRQVGMAFNAYANDWDGILCRFAFTLSGGEKTWARIMLVEGYLDQITAAGCPSLPPIYGNKGSQFNSFGARSTNSLVAPNVFYSQPAVTSYTADFRHLVRIQCTPKAAGFPMLVDTCGTKPTSAITFGRQFSTWYWGAGSGGISEGCVHFRHANRSNVLYADCHVESADRATIVRMITIEMDNFAYEIWGTNIDKNAIRIN